MKPSTRMMVQKYMDEKKREPRRYEEDMRGGRVYDSMTYEDLRHDRRYEDMPRNMTRDYRGGEYNMGGYMGISWDGRMEPDMRSRDGRYMPENRDYRGTEMGFAYESRHPWPMYPDMRRDAYDFNVQGSIADMGYGHASGKLVPMPQRMTREMAERWADEMENTDGSHGPHWDYETVKKTMEQKGIKCDEPTFFAILNNVYSDYATVAKKYGVDKVDFYVDMAKAWIDDPDSVDDKAAMYYRYVVKH